MLQTLRKPLTSQKELSTSNTPLLMAVGKPAVFFHVPEAEKLKSACKFCYVLNKTKEADDNCHRPRKLFLAEVRHNLRVSLHGALFHFPALSLKLLADLRMRNTHDLQGQVSRILTAVDGNGRYRDAGRHLHD